jgi:hypothetical protein
MATSSLAMGILSCLAMDLGLPNTREFFDGSVNARINQSFRSILGPNQACTLFGAVGGSNVITGADYLRVSFELDVKDIWRRNFPILIGFLIVFQLTQVIGLEFYPVRGRSAYMLYMLNNRAAIWH